MVRRCGFGRCGHSTSECLPYFNVLQRVARNCGHAHMMLQLKLRSFVLALFTFRFSIFSHQHSAHFFLSSPTSPLATCIPSTSTSFSPSPRPPSHLILYLPFSRSFLLSVFRCFSYACVCVWAHARTYIHMRKNKHTHAYTHFYAHEHTHKHTYTHTHTHLHTHTHTLTHSHTLTHTHTHTHTHVSSV